MSYATQADLEARYGLAELVQLSNREGGTSVVTEVVARALADADAEIDGYLAARYALPLTTVSAAIVRLACDIARYRLYEHDAPPAVAKRYEDAVRFLRGVADGKVALGMPATEPGSISGGVAGESSERVFSRENLSDYAG
jgi:phage gp36-like protein